MGRSTDHGAGPQALGYLYQVQVALLEFVRRLPLQADLRVRLERVDDVEFDFGVEAEQSLEAVQVKHHKDSKTLTDRATDLWRTLVVWMDLQKRLGILGGTRLTLVTTASIADGEAVSLLQAQDRDEARASSMLLAIAKGAGAQGTQDARDQFAALTGAERLDLLGSITLIGGQPHASDFRSQLKDELRFFLPRGREDLVAHVLDWWYRHAVVMLADQSGDESVSAGQFHGFIDDLRARYGRESLTVDDEFEDEPSQADALSLQDRTFVTQLKLVAANNQLLDLAISDFWRALAQRSRWERSGETSEAEVQAFRRRLREEWRQAFAMMGSQISAEGARANKEHHGLSLFQRLSESTVSLAELREPVITRGSLHGLADSRDIGWHPDFVAELQRILGPK